VPDDPVEAIVAHLPDEGVRRLVLEVLQRNPRVVVADAEAEAVAHRVPQVSTLPDPVAGLTVFLSQPETRVGPQIATASISQRFPWSGTLDLKEELALERASVAVARMHETRLTVISSARRLAIELAFLETQESLLRDDLGTLDLFEALARARYASGVGLGQSVVKIQAEITRAEAALLDLRARRAGLESRLNALRGRTQAAPLPDFQLQPIRTLSETRSGLREDALASHPSLVAARASIAAADTAVSLADTAAKPELSAGLAYTVVGRRDDADPPDDGKDIVGLTGSISLPVWRAPREAAVEEAVTTRLATDERMRALMTDLDARLDDLLTRLPLIEERARLFDTVLIVQAREALDSAIAAYSVGTVAALDLLDAERVLLQARIAAARARADWCIAVVDLEEAVGRPVRFGEAS
jgi:outer membrane protein TolC